MTARVEPIEAAIAERSAAVLVHAGPKTSPAVRYLCTLETGPTPHETGTDGVTAGGRSPAKRRERDAWAVAVVGGRVLVEGPDGDGHPAARLADRLVDALDEPVPDGAESGPTVLAPPSIPHDAALYVEERGFELTSSDAIDRARRRKRDDELVRIEAAQTAAEAGVRRAGEVLAAASVTDGRLHRDGVGLTAARLRREIDAAIVTDGSEPAGATDVETDRDPGESLQAGEPLVLRLAPREPTGYRGALTRTLVPGTDGGWERRAHVAVESALRSVKTMLSADVATVREVETELVAEVGSFGFEHEATAAVAGVGLETGERPVRGASEIPTGTVLALEAGVAAPDGRAVAIGDLLVVQAGDVEWLVRPSRTLDPDHVIGL